MKWMMLIVAGLFTLGSAHAQSLGWFEMQTALGGAFAGSAKYEAEAQTYHLRGPEGVEEPGAAHLLARRLDGDFILRAEVAGEAASGEWGWMIRDSVDAASAYVAAVIKADGIPALRVRQSAGAPEVTTSAAAPVGGTPDILQLERQGGRFILKTAVRGEEFSRPVSVDMNLSDEVVAGLFSGAGGEVNLSNVRIVVPPGPDDTPYQDYLGSNLEILDVDTGERTIVYRSDQSIQAPNWTPDGRALIYNSNGLLYRFDLESGESTVIDTDFATRNNNDHVISFDGTMLGISHHPPEHDGQSIVYTVPIDGGTPKKITERGPSYLHGWSPDGRFLTYTALRDGDYDIYIIPAEGGEEIRLTDAPGLDDGSEYSPDGEYIYFNSVRTGTMEIWRMRPDGSEQEALTDDHLNNWFPHVSPDGSRIVFLSYLPDVAPDDHPFYKQVYLRMMPADGGDPRVIAYLFGGQGTINVPSWSPDGRRIAFVSNTDLL